MKTIVPVAAVAVALGVAGCATGNLPHGAQVVVGGLMVHWSSPQRGTAILVEKTTGKTVATTHLEGGSFDFDAANEHDAGVLSSVLGTAVTNPQFVLYFVPDDK